MADLNFKHHVSEIPAGQALPHPYQGSETVKVTPFPDMQNAVTNYAEATNWMSFIGSAVAARASNAVATRLGSEMGKNPEGDIGVPLTDFDKVMHASYNTQARATLGIQANKLITDANLDIAKAPRITPEMIEQTNQSVSIGLKNIYKHAPVEIQGDLEYHYSNVQASQTAHLTERMLREQREDMRNTTALSSKQNTEDAYSFGMIGNDKAAIKTIETTRQLNEAAVANRTITPQDAKANIDTVRQSYRSGSIVRQYEKKRVEGKDTEFLKELADGKIIKIDDPDYQPIVNNLMQYVNRQQALRSQDQSLRLAKFQTSIAMNPMASDMAQQLQDLKANVTAESFEKAQLLYINAIKNFNKEQGNLTNALTAWNDPSAFARQTEKSINKAFDMQVATYIKQHEQEGKPITLEEAEVQVAVSAGGKVPVFEKSLENKLLNGSPTSIASAVQQMSMLDDMEQGRVYAGISQKAKAIATLFQQQRGSMPDSDLARKITDNLSNVDDKMQKTLDNSWNLILSTKGAGGIGATKTLYDFALSSVGLDKKQVGGTYFGVIYGNDIYNQLNSNFIATRGDYNAAVKMTKDYVDTHYGDTYINGTKQKTDSPIEKYLGYKGNEITPYVQQDLLNQLSVSFNEPRIITKDKEGKEVKISQKEAFSKNLSLDYWETVSLKDNVAEAVRHVKTKDGIKKYHYPINLIGRAGNQWDVVVQTPYGPRNLFLVAPYLGITTYEPNKEAIEKNFKADVHHRPRLIDIFTSKGLHIQE